MNWPALVDQNYEYLCSFRLGVPSGEDSEPDEESRIDNEGREPVQNCAILTKGRFESKNCELVAY
jgi:hypothetical protein